MTNSCIQQEGTWANSKGKSCKSVNSEIWVFASGIIDPQEAKIVTIPWVNCNVQKGFLCVSWDGNFMNAEPLKDVVNEGRQWWASIKTNIKTGCGTLWFSTGIINHMQLCDFLINTNHLVMGNVMHLANTISSSLIYRFDDPLFQLFSDDIIILPGHIRLINQVP